MPLNKPLHILAPTRYPWRFNGPRQSRHRISVRHFLPLNKISKKIEGITVFNPLPPRRFDLVHAFNRIPLGSTPFLIGFESHLPRAFGLQQTGFFRAMSAALTSDRCRAIVAISQYARRQFLRQHDGRPGYDALQSKLVVRYPNIPISPGPDSFQAAEDDPIKLVFIGNHFGRKGGSVALGLAARAFRRGLPLEVHIVSSFEVGAVSWVDPLREGFFDHDRQLLHTLPNVFQHGSLPNAGVLDLVCTAHFTLLPTFSDTFGFSAIESMANYTPVIATGQEALPEFIEDGVNGILLPLETDETGQWKHIANRERSSPAYEALFRDEIERLAEETYSRIGSLLQSPSAYRAMRRNARATAEALFCAVDASAFWDNLYNEILA